MFSYKNCKSLKFDCNFFHAFIYAHLCQTISIRDFYDFTIDKNFHYTNLLQQFSLKAYHLNAHSYDVYFVTHLKRLFFCMFSCQKAAFIIIIIIITIIIMKKMIKWMFCTYIRDNKELMLWAQLSKWNSVRVFGVSSNFPLFWNINAIIDILLFSTCYIVNVLLNYH